MLLDELDALQRANRQARDPEIERRLVRLRHDAFGELDGATPVGPAAHRSDDRLLDAGPGALPEVSRSELDASLLRTAIEVHGGLVVRGVVPEHRAGELVAGIDRAFAGFDAHASGAASADTAPWFDPFVPGDGHSVGMKRKWVRDAGGILAADSPRVLFDLLDTFEEVGLGEVIRGYFGMRPALSMNKCTLRRVPLDTNTDWHQDGAFLGESIRALDVWLSLSHCGVDAPGLDVVPCRLPYLLETGTDGAKFSWSVSPALVDEAAGPSTRCRPVFAPGDVVLFDEFFLHRTACDAAMTRERYAVETWFFPPSAYPEGQIPLVF